MAFSWNDSRRAFADAAMWFVGMADLVGALAPKWIPNPGQRTPSMSIDRT